MADRKARTTDGKLTSTANKGKSRANINRSIRALRVIIDDPKTDQITREIAYAVETALRWATLDTKDWLRPEEDVLRTAEDIRSEYKLK